MRSDAIEPALNLRWVMRQATTTLLSVSLVIAAGGRQQQQSLRTGPQRSGTVRPAQILPRLPDATNRNVLDLRRLHCTC